MIGESVVGQPVLIVHLFLEVGRLNGEQTRREVAEMWHGLHRLNLRRPLGTLPVEPPRAIVPSPRAVRVAGLSCPHEPPCRQAVAWTRQEAFGVSLAISSEPDMPWRLLRAETDAVLPASMGTALLEKVFVHRGLAPVAAAPDARVTAAVSRLSRRLRRHPADRPGPWTRTPEGFLLWEILGSRSRSRSLAVLSSGPESDLDAWTWQTDSAEPPPLTRHLLHAARLHDQYLVVQDSRARQTALDAAARAGADRLLAMDRDQGRSTPLDELLQAKAAAASLTVSIRDLTTRSSDLRTVNRTLETVNDSLARTIPESEDERSGSPLAADRVLGVRLAAQVADDAFYLQESRDRATAVLGQINLSIEQGLRTRQQQLTLVQTSVISAMLMILAAVQALAYRLPLPGPVQPALIAFLAALALSLPTAIFRFSRADGGVAPFAAFDLASIGLLGGAAGWLAVACLAEIRPHDPATVRWSLYGAAAGALSLTAAAVLRIYRLRRSARSHRARL